MIQELWKHSIKWDEDLPSEHQERWSKWLSSLNNLNAIQIPRPYFPVSIHAKQLHVFCDSSKLAYGAVAYFRGASYNAAYITFLMAKTRVAPIKTQTLPRLELSAALLGAKLSAYLKKALNIADKECETIHWSDSQIVLSWLTSNKQLQQFVRSRVQKIKENSSLQS